MDFVLLLLVQTWKTTQGNILVKIPAVKWHRVIHSDVFFMVVNEDKLYFIRMTVQFHFWIAMMNILIIKQVEGSVFYIQWFSEH